MQIHLDEIGSNVAAKAHAVVLMDRAGWDRSYGIRGPVVNHILTFVNGGGKSRP
jgi:hypothetical protein